MTAPIASSISRPLKFEGPSSIVFGEILESGNTNFRGETGVYQSDFLSFRPFFTLT